MKRSVVFFCCMTVASFALANGDKATRRQQFNETFPVSVEPVRTNTVEQLRAILNEPFPGDIPLADIVLEPETDVSKGNLNDIFETELGPTGSGKVPLETTIEYLRKISAISRLKELNPDEVLTWLMSRKDTETPTLLDAIGVMAATEGHALRDATKDRRAEWEELMNAKNPFARLAAVKCAPEWTTQEEAAPVLEKAFADPYVIVRRSALDSAKAMWAPSVRITVETFVQSPVRLGLSSEQQAKEYLLKKEATMLLEERVRQNTL